MTSEMVDRLLEGLLYAHADVERLRQRHIGEPIASEFEAICERIGSYFAWEGTHLVPRLPATEPTRPATPPQPESLTR